MPEVKDPWKITVDGKGPFDVLKFDLIRYCGLKSGEVVWKSTQEFWGDIGENIWDELNVVLEGNGVTIDARIGIHTMDSDLSIAAHVLYAKLREEDDPVKKGIRLLTTATAADQAATAAWDAFHAHYATLSTKQRGTVMKGEGKGEES